MILPLRDCAQAHGGERRKSPPREGPALPQGLALCGIRGNRMTVRDHVRGQKPQPNYVCQRYGIEHGEPICQSISGAGIDQAISELLVEAVTPVALDVALNVQGNFSRGWRKPAGYGDDYAGGSGPPVSG